MPTPQVDFYLLNDSDAKDFCCRLTEKIYRRKHRLYIHAATEKIAHDLDELLWTFKDVSFIPHNLYGEGPTPAPPVQIGFNDAPKDHRDILLNFGESVPEFYTQFRRVLEIIPNDEATIEQGRANYRHYRNDKCEVNTHKIA